MKKGKKTGLRTQSAASKKAAGKGLISSASRLIGQIITRGIPLLTIYKEAVKKKNRKRWKRIRRALIWLALAVIAGIIQAIASELVHSLVMQAPVEKVSYIKSKLSMAMVHPEIEIIYRGIPEKLITDFEASINKSINVKSRREGNVDHYDAGAEIVIYFKEHLTEIIVNGVIVPSLLAAVMFGLSKLWTSIINRYKKKKDTQGIDLVFQMKDNRSIEFSLNSDADIESVELHLKYINTYLRDKQQQERDFNNPDFREKRTTKPRIRIRQNPDTGKIEVVNFAELEQQNQELLKRFRDRLES